MDFDSTQQYAKDEAERMAEGDVLDAIDENLPEDVDQREWNWEALAKMVNTRWRLNVRDRDLKRVGREDLAEDLIDRARAAVQRIDLGQGARFLDPDFGVQTACGWVRHKFGVELAPDDVRQLELEPFKELVRNRAVEAYDEKEIEYPVMAGLYHFTTRDTGGHKRYDREKLVEWVRERFDAELSLDDLRNKQRDEIRALLIEHSSRYTAKAAKATAEARAWVEKLFGDEDSAERVPRDHVELQALADWLADHFRCEVSADEIAAMTRRQLENHLANVIDEKFRLEMRKMERALVLQLLDGAWKDHLLAMDHLRSSVGLRGYAQVDPKVEYKREGMRTFEVMWDSIGERVTDLIFRMEQLDESFVGSTWTEAEAIHEDAASASEIASQQQAAIDGTQADHKPEPIRHRQKRVGRNEPCPCGSGKKFKNCCMRKGSGRPV
jgi:preprotein translocase subunit SecA